jgi:hypothetical protein
LFPMAAAPPSTASGSGSASADVCCICTKPTSTPSSYRCAECNAIKSRLARFMKDRPGLSQDWQSAMTGNKVDRTAFFAAAHNLFGSDLEKHVQATLEMTCAESSEVSMKGTGLWLDEFDLAKKYAGKDRRLAAILKNCRRFWDETSETELFEDMEFTSVVSETSTTCREEKRAAHTEERFKKTKVPRVPRVKPELVEGGAASVFDVKQLTFVQQKWLGKAQEDMKKQVAALTAVRMEVLSETPWGVYVPRHIACSCEAAGVKAAAVCDSLSIIVEANQASDFKKTQAEYKDSVAEVKEEIRKASLQIKEAKKMVPATDDDEEAKDEAAAPPTKRKRANKKVTQT